MGSKDLWQNRGSLKSPLMKERFQGEDKIGLVANLGFVEGEC